MNTIVAVLLNTPWWVYLLLLILIRRGLAAARPRTMPLWKLAILPAIFLILDISALADQKTVTGAAILVWLVFLACGAGAAAFMARHAAIRADRAKFLIAVPGDPRILPLALVIFVLKYAVGYIDATAPALAAAPAFAIFVLALSSFCTGMFVGRFCTYATKFFSAPSQSLLAGPA